jgi:hypothetical protein
MAANPRIHPNAVRRLKARMTKRKGNPDAAIGGAISAVFYGPTTLGKNHNPMPRNGQPVLLMDSGGAVYLIKFRPDLASNLHRTGARLVLAPDETRAILSRRRKR